MNPDTTTAQERTVIETTQGAVTPQDFTRHTTALPTQGSGSPLNATIVSDPLVGLSPAELLMLAIAGEILPERAWHYFRRQSPTLQQWTALGRMQGYARGWAQHQYRCWTEQSNALNYPQQRALWAQRDAIWLEEQQEQALPAGVAVMPLRGQRRRPSRDLAPQLSLLG